VIKCYVHVRHGDCEQNVYSKVVKGHSLRSKRFRAGFGAKNEERESKNRAKNGARRGEEERKETPADKP